MVFQSYALYPHMTVADNMGFSLKLRKADPKLTASASRSGEDPQPRPYLERFPRELSGGQRQRVAMGRAIVRDPKVFLFDEPLSNLDAKLRVAMRAEIKALHQRLKTTTVYVTHDQVEAMTMADKIVVMQDGRIEQIGTPLELYDRPANLFVAQFIGSPSMNVSPGTLRAPADAAWVEAEGGMRWPLPASAPGATARRWSTASARATSSLGGGRARCRPR
jgi:multiple sugar transport system ATP-binding protein